MITIERTSMKVIQTSVYEDFMATFAAISDLKTQTF